MILASKILVAVAVAIFPKDEQARLEFCKQAYEGSKEIIINVNTSELYINGKMYSFTTEGAFKLHLKEM